MSAAAKLTRGSIRGHLVSQTLPMIIGVAAMMSVGLADSYFIGQLGSAQLAAIAFIFPVGVSLGSLGVGVMVGINSVIARALGADQAENARQFASVGVVFALGFGALLGLALALFSDPLFALLQAEAELRPLITAYMVPYAFGIPLLLLQMGLSGILRGQGEARKTSLISLSYALTNWVLDPILITGAFGFEGFGIKGAAFATLIGWSVAITLALYLIRSTAIRPSLAALRHAEVKAPLRSITKVAAPAAFANAINPIGLTVLTGLVAAHGAEAVAGFGAAGRIQSFAVVPLLALSGSIGAIVGQNWGAGLYARSRKAFFYAAGFALVYGLAIAALLVASSRWLADIFSNDPAVIEQFVNYFAIAAWGYGGFGLLIIGNGVLNAVDRSSFALGQSIARVFLVMLPFAWLLRGQWGAQAIYAAELTANVIGGLVSAALVWWVLSRPENKQPAQEVTVR